MTLEETCHFYYDMIYSRCLFKLFFNEQLAEDTTQEVFAVLCRKWDRLKKDNIKAWLIRTADFKILQARAGFSRHNKISSIEYDLLAEESQTLDMDQQVLIHKLLQDFDLYYDSVISQLSDKEVKLIHYLQDELKYAEIAVLIHSSEAAVAMAVCRLRKKVSSIIQQLFLDL